MKKIINWFKNYFYYYKVWAIVIAVGVAIAGFTIYHFATRERYDYTVYLCISETVPGDFSNAVKAALIQYGEDTDGDGSVNVQIVDMSYYFGDKSSDEAIAKTTLLAGELSSGKGYIFLYDEDYYEKKLSAVFEELELPDKDGKALDIGNTEFEEYIKYGVESVGLDPEKVPDMYMSLRKAPDKSSKAYELYENSKTLFMNIMNNKITAKAG